VFCTIHRADAKRLTVLEASSDALIVAYPDETLQDAITKMVTNDIGRLPVVRRDGSHRVAGYLERKEVMAARLRRHEEEHVREPGWLSRAVG